MASNRSLALVQRFDKRAVTVLVDDTMDSIKNTYTLGRQEGQSSPKFRVIGQVNTAIWITTQQAMNRPT